MPIELTIEREAQCWELHKQGFSQADIAEKLSTPQYSFSQQSVSKALRRVEERLMEDLNERAERHKVRQLARLDGIYTMAMASFRQSREGKKPPARKTASKHCPGDPRFLEKALEALRDQRKVLGIDAPIKFDASIKGDRPYEDLTDDELQREHAVLEARLAEQLRKRKES